MPVPCRMRSMLCMWCCALMSIQMCLPWKLDRLSHTYSNTKPDTDANITTNSIIKICFDFYSDFDTCAFGYSASHPNECLDSCPNTRSNAFVGVINAISNAFVLRISNLFIDAINLDISTRHFRRYLNIGIVFSSILCIVVRSSKQITKTLNF
jgi:hypothetical protein